MICVWCIRNTHELAGYWANQPQYAAVCISWRAAWGRSIKWPLQCRDMAVGDELHLKAV